MDKNNILYAADTIRHIFGLNSPVYVPYGKNEAYRVGDYPNLRLLPDDELDDETSMSEFGTPIFGPITFEAGEFNTYNRKTGAVERLSMDAYTLPSSCIVSYSRDANLTKTEVLGSTGTVKEIYGKGDWGITIRGVAQTSRDGGGETAQQQIDELLKWENLCDSIPVLGSIFRRKGIYNIVIENISLQPIVGRWNDIPFQIDAVSDEPIDLLLL